MARSGVIPLMRALAQNPRTAAQLAAALDLSPAETTARLAALRDIFGAAAQNQNGEWRLTFAPQWLDANFLSAALPALSVAVKDETPGTNALARRAGRNTAFFAEHQTRGRGRRNREWLATPAGSIAMSARLPAPKQTAGLSLAIGAALWRALDGDKNKLRLKWPNDLLNDRREKIGGVLIDATGGDIIAGVGINLVVHRKLQTQIARPVAALRMRDTPSRNTLAARVCAAVCRAGATFARDGLAAFLADAKAAHFLADGGDIRFHSGEEEVRGAFAGFGGDGALLIRRRGGVRAYISGEICVAGG